MRKALILIIPVLLFIGCSKDMNEPDVKISDVAGIHYAYSYSVEGTNNAIFCKDL